MKTTVIAAAGMSLFLAATPAYATESIRLTDDQMDQVTAGLSTSAAAALVAIYASYKLGNYGSMMQAAGYLYKRTPEGLALQANTLIYKALGWEIGRLIATNEGLPDPGPFYSLANSQMFAPTWLTLGAKFLQLSAH